MKKQDYTDFVEDIYNAILFVEKYTEGYCFEDFEQDDKTYNAVIRMLEVIGEASNKLSDEVKARYHDVPWHLIRGLRNRIIHEYFGIDLRVIWNITKDNLPQLKVSINNMLNDLETNKPNI